VGAGNRGDAATAKALLAQAKRTEPVPFTVAYRSSATSDKAMAALVAGWRLAGFEPRPDPSPMTTSPPSATQDRR
jgi:peptide/nickel transport system substrate-binding protein